jgi:hypothetical protein
MLCPRGQCRLAAGFRDQLTAKITISTARDSGCCSNSISIRVKSATAWSSLRVRVDNNSGRDAMQQLQRELADKRLQDEIAFERFRVEIEEARARQEAIAAAVKRRKERLAQWQSQNYPQFVVIWHWNADGGFCSRTRLGSSSSTRSITARRVCVLELPRDEALPARLASRLGQQLPQYYGIGVVTPLRNNVLSELQE